MASSNKRRTVPHVNTNDGKGNSYRPQNQHPDGLVRYHERLAEQHREQVRVTVQAMHRRKMKPHEITVAAVVKESGVASATIYRNDDLFALIQHANPNVQRRQAGQVYERTIHQLQEELAKAKADREYYQKEAQLAKSGGQQPVIQLKKMILFLSVRALVVMNPRSLSVLLRETERLQKGFTRTTPCWHEQIV